MLAAYIIVGFVIWLMLGCFVVAIIHALGLDSDLDVSTAACAACAVLLWPVALILLIVLSCELFARHLGKHPEWLIPVGLVTITVAASFLLKLIGFGG